MKKSMGNDIPTLVRDTRNARRAAPAVAGLAAPPPAVVTALAITIFWFGQITSQTFRNISVPNAAPVRIVMPQGSLGFAPRNQRIRKPERKVSSAPHRNHQSARGTSFCVATLLVDASASAKNGPCTKLTW